MSGQDLHGPRVPFSLLNCPFTWEDLDPIYHGSIPGPTQVNIKVVKLPVIYVGGKLPVTYL